MDKVLDWGKLLMDSLTEMFQNFASAIPGIVGALLILFIGWLIAKLVSRVVVRLLKYLKFDELTDRVQLNDLLAKGNIKKKPSGLLGKFFYYMIMLTVITIACENLGWTAVTDQISKLMALLPKLLIATVIFIIGTYFASFVRDIIKGATSSLSVGTGKLLANVIYYFLMAVITITALGQIGIDTSLITNNMLLILGAVLLAGAVSYGVASKDVMSNMIAGYFSKSNFKNGQTIEVDGIKGQIVDSNNVSVTINNGGERIVIPTSELLNKKVKIFS